MVEAANPVGTIAFALIAGCDRLSKGPRTDGAKGDPYLLQSSGHPLEDGSPLVGALGRDGSYNRVRHPHLLGGGRRSDDDSY